MKKSSRPMRPCAALFLYGLLASCGADVDPPTTSPEPESAWTPVPAVYLDTVYDIDPSQDEAALWGRLPVEVIELESSGCYGACPQ